MLTYLNLGYATAGSDAGRSLAASGNSSYVPFLDDRAEVQAWIHNSVAMTTHATRSLVTKYYAEPPDFSYYWGCSTGGAQGFSLAQYHPELFDGIYAGSPGNWYSHLILSFLWNGLKTANVSGGGYMSQQVLSFITEQVLDACDAIDGVKDGIIENPLRCSFNISTLECGSFDQQSVKSSSTLCLTADQIDAAQAIYNGPKDTRTGEEVYPGLSLGSENGWIYQETILYPTYTEPILRQLAFHNPEFNVSQFNWATDIDAVNQNVHPLIDAISPDLSAFQRRGGKLITTQGWSDQFNSALWPLQYLQQIQNTMQERPGFIHVFMVPGGGGHCGANPYYPYLPAVYHVLEALVPWVERGIEPVQMRSSEPPDGSNTTRKLCAWPKTARFVGGDVDNWGSYMCA